MVPQLVCVYGHNIILMDLKIIALLSAWLGWGSQYISVWEANLVHDLIVDMIQTVCTALSSLI